MILDITYFIMNFKYQLNLVTFFIIKHISLMFKQYLSFFCTKCAYFFPSTDTSFCVIHYDALTFINFIGTNHTLLFALYWLYIVLYCCIAAAVPRVRAVTSVRVGVEICVCSPTSTITSSHSSTACWNKDNIIIERRVISWIIILKLNIIE